MLAEKLNMNVDDAESWIVNLIRNAEMDAKIDSKKVTLSPLLYKYLYTSMCASRFSFKSVYICLKRLKLR